MVVVSMFLWLVVELDSGSSVSVEAHYGLLSSDIALVFHLDGGRVCFCVVLVVSDRLFMPVNCLYCADVNLGEL
jgi:hypothetical protein